MIDRIVAAIKRRLWPSDRTVDRRLAVQRTVHERALTREKRAIAEMRRLERLARQH